MGYAQHRRVAHSVEDLCRSRSVSGCLRLNVDVDEMRRGLAILIFNNTSP